MGTDRLSDRALNRATLARQLLLERSALEPIDAVRHLVGLQAQVPLNPYLALWSRLDAFDPDAVGRLMLEGRLVRIVVMRGTIHLVTTEDAAVLRPLVQPVLDAELTHHPDHTPALDGVDLAPVLAFARELLAVPQTMPKLRDALAGAFPGQDPAALAYACRNYLALVQVPPRGVWGKTSQVTLATLESWTGAAVESTPSLDAVVLRYLAAFGPATVADVAAWSRLTALREVLERLRPGLRTFTDERGRELFDVPDAPMPDPDTPAPVRVLPEYDNALLSHADRSRFQPADGQGDFSAAGPIRGTVLVDGVVRAVWRTEQHKASKAVTMTVSHTGRLTKRDASSVEAECRRALRFMHADAPTHDVHFTPLDP